MFKTVNGGKLPTKGSKYSACVDLFSNEDVVIGAGETKLIGLGVCIDLDKLKESKDFQQVNDFAFDIKYWRHFLSSHYLQLMLRSSLGKKGLILPNGVGIIDLDYEYEIKMIIHNPIQEFHITWWIDRLASQLGLDTNYNNNNTANVLVKKGERIAQTTLLEHKSYLFGVDTETERNGGFGSTGS